MKHVVASGHRLVTEAALEILKAGGNVFDAAVAAGFASSVAESTMSSPGGGGYLLARTASGEEILFDFFVDTPGKRTPEKAPEPGFFPITVNFPGYDQIFNVGSGSSAVPGVLKGLLHVHRRMGRKPASEVLEPAIKMARMGVPLNQIQAYALELLSPILKLTKESRALYAQKGQFLKIGELIKNPDLASFLETLSNNGEKSFYEGELAERISGDAESNGGLFTFEDLRSYRVIERKPLSVSYRGHSLLTNPAPSSGGTLIALSLLLLEKFAPERVHRDSPSHLNTLAETMREVDFLKVEKCANPEAFSTKSFRKYLRTFRSTSGNTTHISIADAEGNIASMTTSNGEGSGYIVPGTGIMLNNMMGEDDLHPKGFHKDPPGKRIASMMAPSMLLKDNEVRLVLGSAGSKRIRTAIFQVINNVIDSGLSIRDAVESPRIHLDGNEIQIEPGFPEESLKALKEHWPVRVWDAINLYFGGVNAVIPGKEGHGDPRRGGYSAWIEK